MKGVLLTVVKLPDATHNIDETKTFRTDINIFRSNVLRALSFQ